MKRILFILLLALLSGVTMAQQTNRLPILRGFLQSDFDGNSKQMTNVSSLSVSGAINATNQTTYVNGGVFKVQQSGNGNSSGTALSVDENGTVNGKGNLWNIGVGGSFFFSAGAVYGDATGLGAPKFIGPLYGDGANATNLNASQLTSGTVPMTRLDPKVVTNNAVTGNNRVQLGNGGRGVKDAAASGPVPIDADGSAATAPQIVATGLGLAAYSNSFVKVLGPLAGNNAIPDMQSAAAPDYIGQLGLTYSGGKEAALWIGLSNNAGPAGWDVSDLLFPQGIHQIGDLTTMPTNSTAGLKIFFNGNREYTRKFYATNFAQARNSSEIIVRNMNPRTDGNGIYFPMMGVTNTASGVVGYITNADNEVIYDIDQFGLTLATLPYDYVVGETNMAGSYCIITGVGNQIPLYICQNAQLAGEPTLGQKAWVCFDPRGIVDSTKPGGTHFQMWLPNVYAVTNAGNKDVFYVDQTTTGARLEILTNTYLKGGGVYATNYTKTSAFGTGPFYDITKGACLITGTNVQFQWDSGHNSDGCWWTFDAYTLNREGIMQKSGDYACWVHGLTAPWQVKQSSASDLSSALSGQTLTTELLIDSSRNFGSFCASNYVQNATRIDGTLSIGNGTPVRKVISATATLDFASTSAQNSRDLTITATGAALGDVVTLGVPNASVNANTCYTAYVSATDTVTVRFNNYSAGAVDPASGTFRVTVIQH